MISCAELGQVICKTKFSNLHRIVVKKPIEIQFPIESQWIFAQKPSSQRIKISGAIEVEIDGADSVSHLAGESTCFALGLRVKD